MALGLFLRNATLIQSLDLWLIRFDLIIDLLDEVVACVCAAMGLVVVEVGSKLVSDVVGWCRDVRIMRSILSLRELIQNRMILGLVRCLLWDVWQGEGLSHALSLVYILEGASTIKTIEILTWMLKRWQLLLVVNLLLIWWCPLVQLERYHLGLLGRLLVVGGASAQFVDGNDVWLLECLMLPTILVIHGDRVHRIVADGSTHVDLATVWDIPAHIGDGSKILIRLLKRGDL